MPAQHLCTVYMLPEILEVPHLDFRKLTVCSVIVRMKYYTRSDTDYTVSSVIPTASRYYISKQAVILCVFVYVYMPDLCACGSDRPCERHCPCFAPPAVSSLMCVVSSAS